VVHQTDRYTVTKFGREAIVLEKVQGGKVVGVRPFAGLDWREIERGWTKAIAEQVDTRPIKEPFAVDRYFDRIWEQTS